MDFIQLKELISIIDNSSLVDFDLNMDNVSVFMSKIGKTEKVEKLKKPVEVISNISEETSEKSYRGPVTIIPEEKKEIKEGTVVTSPIVGTFYESSAPDKPPFVKIGSKVSEGDVLCIVEAMKIMNEITAKTSGEVVEIFVNNEDMVEYGAPLFRIV